MAWSKNARKAADELKALGAPVYEHLHGENGCQFIIGAELRTSDDSYYADYYQEEVREQWDRTDVPVGERKVINAHGVRQDVRDILAKYDLFDEWINPGQLGIYDENAPTPKSPAGNVTRVN